VAGFGVAPITLTMGGQTGIVSLTDTSGTVLDLYLDANLMTKVSQPYRAPGRDVLTLYRNLSAASELVNLQVLVEGEPVIRGAYTLTSTGVAITVPAGPASGGGSSAPRQVIWDTDWYTDVDDAVDARGLLYFERMGYFDIVAAIVDTAAVNGAPSLDGFFRSEGNRAITIGQVSPDLASDLVSGGPYQANMLTATKPLAGNASLYPDSTTVYRTALANAAGKVDLICVGYMHALQGLLQSSADSISPLTGQQLVTAKVNRIWMAAGSWPSGTENNFSRTTTAKAAATYVITTLTTLGTPITFLGYEVGVSVTVGQNMYGAVPTSDLLLKALTDHGSTAGRPAWGPLMTQMAALGSPTAAGYTVVQGTAAVDSNGANTFTPSASGPHQYVVKALSDSAYGAAINQLLVPGRQPSSSHPVAFQNRVLGQNSINVLGSQPASMIACLRATDFTGADGASVVGMPAGNGIGPVWSQPTSGQRPTYSASVSGRAALHFTGAQIMPTASALATTTQMTVYARVRWATVPSGTAQTVVSQDNGSPNRAWHLKGSTTATAQTASFVAQSGVTDATGTLVNGTWHLLCFRRDATHLEAFLDNVSDGATTISSPDIPTAIIRIGASAGSLTEPLTADVAEVRVYSGYHSTAQMALVAASM
jgi:purine nucleosidase